MGMLICAEPVAYAMSDEMYLETPAACGLDGNVLSSMLAPRLYVKSDSPAADTAEMKTPATSSANNLLFIWLRIRIGI